MLCSDMRDGRHSSDRSRMIRMGFILLQHRPYTYFLCLGESMMKRRIAIKDESVKTS